MGKKSEKSTKSRNPNPISRKRTTVDTWRKFFNSAILRVSYWGLVLAIWSSVLGGGIIAYYAYGLPSVDAVFTATRRPAVTILAADGSELATIGDLYGETVNLRELPPVLLQAVIATEDRRFYSHFGIDIFSLVRATLVNLRAGRIRQGGSTITQQVAKNLFLSPERTIKRKIQEMLLALWLERKFTKDQILTVYLNRVYLGQGTWGVDAAARKYFSRPATELSLWESAIIAGLLKAPSRLNPVTNPQGASNRARVVLANMVSAGYLIPEEAGDLRPAKTKQTNTPINVGSRYFVDWVLERLPGYLSIDRNIIVHTTLDPTIQFAATSSLVTSLDRLGKERHVNQGALIAMTPDGALRAMVGGYSYMISQFNRATQAKRQPGSAFKPVVFLAGLEAGLDSHSILIDEPIKIDNWEPRNFNNEYRGPIALADALATSVNTVAVKVGQYAGWEEVVKTARRLGLSSNLKPVPSIALGSGEVTLLSLTGAYATFANGGMGVWPYGISEIRDLNGTVLYKRIGGGLGRIVAPEHVEAMNKMLAKVMSVAGTGKRALLSRPAAGKTGTSQDYRDGWFVGYTADVVMGVWMGNDDGSKTRGVTGGGLPATIWREAMLAAHQGIDSHPLPGQKENTPQEYQSSGQDGLLSDIISLWRSRDN